MNRGDEKALGAAFAAGYKNLRAMAAQHMRKERSGHTMQPTELVHEAFLALASRRELHFPSKGHFFAAVASVIRTLLVNYALYHRRAKRGGGRRKLLLIESMAVTNERPIDLLALHEGLNKLASQDSRAARIVEMKFFGGLSTKDIAEVLEVSTRTVEREWSWARAVLHRDFKNEETPEELE